MIDLSEYPVVDHHAHMFSQEAQKANPLQRFSILETPKNLEHQLLYRCAARALAKLYTCKPEEEEIFKVRKVKAQNFKEFVSYIFAEANIKVLIVDTSYPPTMSVDDFREIVPVKVYPVERFDEFLFDELLDNSHTFDELLDTYHERLNHWIKREGVVGLKAIGAYYTGLNIEKVEREEAEQAFQEFQKTDKSHYLVDYPFGQTHYVEPKKLRDYLFWEAIDKCAEYNVPMQIHTGDGDMAMRDLMAANPILLQKHVLNDKRTQNAELVLVHAGYPQVEFASYLSHLYPNVHIDFSFLNPFINVFVGRKIEEAFMWAPFTRILYGSDAFVIPELYWFGATLFKQELGRVLEDLVKRDALDEDYAYEVGKMILSENVKKLYNI
ncbi:MAG: amidohydrolase family protein [Candidatus Hodarchaeota archaeon]